MRARQLNIGEEHIFPVNVNSQPQRAANNNADHVNNHHNNDNAPDNNGAADPGGEPDNVAPPAPSQIDAEARTRRYALPLTKRGAEAPIANEEETAIQQAYDTRLGKTKTYRDAAADPASSKRSALTMVAIEAQHPAQQDKGKAKAPPEQMEVVVAPSPDPSPVPDTHHTGEVFQVDKTAAPTCTTTPTYTAEGDAAAPPDQAALTSQAIVPAMATEEEDKASPDTDMDADDTAEPLLKIDSITGQRTGSPLVARGGVIKKKRTPVPKTVPKSL